MRHKIGLPQNPMNVRTCREESELTIEREDPWVLAAQPRWNQRRPRDGIELRRHHRSQRVRWNWSKSYTTTLLNDFDPVLAALIAKYGNEAQNYFEAARAAEKAGTDKPQTQDSTLDKLYAIWESVFPQREIKMADASFLAVMPETRAEYPAPEMSDGERAVLYLAAQVLCVPEEKILIVDEPEIHLHHSLIARLWRALEQARPDCLFVYITHDIQFATEHAHSDIVCRCQLTRDDREKKGRRCAF